jgi:hypothetical protein
MSDTNEIMTAEEVEDHIHDLKNHWSLSPNYGHLVKAVMSHDAALRVKVKELEAENAALLAELEKETVWAPFDDWLDDNSEVPCDGTFILFYNPKTSHLPEVIWLSPHSDCWMNNDYVIPDHILEGAVWTHMVDLPPIDESEEAK